MTRSASLTPEAAAAIDWDAVVVGAGPSGSMAALGMARRGSRVLLVDRAEFPRKKVCGCCLNGAALAALEAAGLGTLTDECGAAPLGRVQLSAGRRSASLRLRRQVVVSREALDNALIAEAASTGAAFLPGTHVRLGACAPTGRALLLRCRGIDAWTRARVVIAADGLGGRLMARSEGFANRAAPRARIGVGTVVELVPDFYQPGVVYMACGAGGYVGLVRLEDGRLDVAAALDTHATRAGSGPGIVVENLLNESGWPLPKGLAELDWKGTPPLTWSPNRVAAERVFAVGDAAGYVEPFTGEGIARALTAGMAVVPIAARAIARWEERLIRDWTATHRRVVARRQLACRAASAVLRRPRLVSFLIRVLAAAPALATPVIRSLNRPLSLDPRSL